MGGEERIVVLAEIPLAVLAAYEAQLRIEQMPVRMAAGSEILPVLILSEHLGCPCKSSVGKSIFQLEGHGFGHQITRDVTVLHPQALSPLFQQGAGLHCIVGPLIIKAFQALDNGIGNSRDGWIAHHAVGLAAMKMPNREFPLLIVDVEHGVDEIRVAPAVDNAVKRHGCPVGVPEGENGVGLVARVGMYKAVRSPVGAVAVAENGRRNHSVEKGGVENLAGPLICRFNSDSREFPVPLLLSAAAHSLEIPGRQFRKHIGTGSLHADRRKGDLEKDRLPFRSTERQAGIVPHPFKRAERPGELGIEINPLVLGPTGGIAPSAKRLVPHSLNVGLSRLVPASPVLQIEDQGGLPACREGVAVEAHASRGRELGQHSIAQQRHAVIARTANLAGAVGVGP